MEVIKREKLWLKCLTALFVSLLIVLIFMQSAKITKQQATIKDYQHTVLIKTQQVDNLTKIIAKYEKK